MTGDSSSEPNHDGSPLSLEELADCISSLSPSNYLEFLVGVVGRLVLAGRDAYAPVDHQEHEALLRLKACNEVLEVLGHALFDVARSRVPDADHARLILEDLLYRAKFGGIEILVQKDISDKLRAQRRA